MKARFQNAGIHAAKRREHADLASLHGGSRDKDHKKEQRNHYDNDHSSKTAE